MRRLTIAVAILAILYSAYWFVGASATERGAKGALDGLMVGLSAREGRIEIRSDRYIIALSSGEIG